MASGALYAAGFFPDAQFGAAPPATAPLWQSWTSDSWSLEARCGFALPRSAHAHLRQTASSFQPAQVGPTTPEGPPPARSRPARHDRVLFGGRTVTYGRWLHDDPPDASWDDGRYRIDVLGAVAREPTSGRLRLAYRIVHHDAVVLARSDLTLPASAVISGDTTIRLARDHALTRPDTSPDERAWLTGNGDELTARTEPPPAPFPPGTPIVVDAGGYRGPTTGQVIRASVDAAGRIVGYYWRPDAYNHVGHRYRRETYRWLLSAAGDVRPTLQAPDPGPADLVGYGAQVRAIDHPDLLTGTVLRLGREPGQTTVCEVQPDHPASSPITIAATDLQIIARHGWLTIADLTAARDEAGLPLAADEIMVTVRERALVSAGPSGPIVRRVQAAPRRPDPLLDPEAHQPEARFRDPLRPPLPPLGPAPGTPEFPGP